MIIIGVSQPTVYQGFLVSNPLSRCKTWDQKISKVDQRQWLL